MLAEIKKVKGNLKSKDVLKGEVIVLRSSIIKVLEFWNTLLLAKGYERIDDVHTRGIFSLFYHHHYKVHYKKL